MWTPWKGANSEESRQGLKAWESWVRLNAMKGMRNAHLHSKALVAWAPTTTIKEGGIVTADPLDLLGAYRDTFKELWGAAEGEEEVEEWEPCIAEKGADEVPMEPLSTLTPQQLREASSAFKRTTATSFDGFGMRHFNLMTDECLEALGKVYTIAETIGFFPKQLRAVPVPLLPKPKGGHRPIGIFPSVYRLWTKARRAEAEKWESKNDRGYWATGKGRGAHDAVWKQAVKMEVRGAGGGYAATLLWDAESFFERISHWKTAARARRTGFPMQITRVAGNMYRSPRLVSLNGFVGRELLPRKGVVAGLRDGDDTHQSLLPEPFDEFVSKVKRSKRATVPFDAYVDDFSTTVEGETEEDVVETMVEAEQLLLHIVGADLQAKVAIGKVGLVATTDALARKLRSRMGALAGAKADTIANLGIDYNGGRKRNAKGGAPNRKKRLRGAFARRTRLASLRKALSRRQLTGIFTAGRGVCRLWGRCEWLHGQ